MILCILVRKLIIERVDDLQWEFGAVPTSQYWWIEWKDIATILDNTEMLWGMLEKWEKARKREIAMASTEPYRKSEQLAMRIWSCPHGSLLMNRVEWHCCDIGQHRIAVGSARKLREIEKTRHWVASKEHYRNVYYAFKDIERESYHFFVPSIVAYLLSQLWCSKHHLLFRSCISPSLHNTRLKKFARSVYCLCIAIIFQE